MGCDIHTSTHQQDADGAWQNVDIAFPDEYEIIEGGILHQPFYWRNNATFAFLANVKNYKNYMPVLSLPRGFPEDMGGDDIEIDDVCHNPSWYLLSELLDADYSQNVTYGAFTNTLKEYLPDDYFRDLEIMKTYCDANGLLYTQLRIVFYFDN